MRRFLAACFYGDAAKLQNGKGKDVPSKEDINHTSDEPLKCKRPQPQVGFVHPSNDLPVLDRDAFLSTVGNLQGAAVATAIVVSADPTGEGLPLLQSVWTHSHSGVGQAAQKAASLLATVQPLLGGLGGLLTRVESLQAGLEAAARCALKRQYCRVKHRLGLGEEGLQLQPGPASAAHAVVEIGSCALALSATERKPGVLVVVKTAPGKPAAAAAAAGPQSVSPRPRALCPPCTPTPATATTEHSTRPAERPAAKAAPAAEATAALCASGLAQGGRDGTTKCHSVAAETDVAARAIAAESIPATVMAFVLNSLGEPDVMVYVNQQGREYLGLEAGNELPRVGCRGLLQLLLEDLGMSLRDILSEASKEQGFTTMIRAPAEVNLRDWALGSGGGGLQQRSGTLGENLMCGVAPHAPMNGIAECPSREEFEEEEEQEQGGPEVQEEQERQEAESEQEPLKGSARPQSEAPQGGSPERTTSRGLQALLGASMDREASLSISEGHGMLMPQSPFAKTSFTSRVLQPYSIISSTGMTSRADSFALTTSQDSASHGHPGARSLLADTVRQRYAIAPAAAVAATAAAAAAQYDITDQQLLQRLASTTVAKQARDVCFQNTPPHHTLFATSSQAYSLEKRDSVAAASRRIHEAPAGAAVVGSGASGESASAGAGSTPSGNPTRLCSQPTPSSLLAVLAPGGLAGADSTPILRLFPAEANGEGACAQPVMTTAVATVGVAAPVPIGQGPWSVRARKTRQRVTTAAAGELVRRVAADALKSGIGGGVRPAVGSPARRPDVLSSSMTSGPACAAGGNAVFRPKAYGAGRRLGQQGLGGECRPDEAVAGVAAALAMAPGGRAPANYVDASVATPAPNGAASPGAPSVSDSGASPPAPGSCLSPAAVTTGPKGAEPLAAAQAAASPSIIFTTEVVSGPAQRHKAAIVGVSMLSTLAAPSPSSLGTPSGLLMQSSILPFQADGMGARPAAAAATAAAAAQTWQDKEAVGASSEVATAADSGAANPEGPINTATTNIATAPIDTSASKSVGFPEVSASNGRQPSYFNVIRSYCSSPADQLCNEPNLSLFVAPAKHLPYDGERPGVEDPDAGPDSLPTDLALGRPPLSGSQATSSGSQATSSGPQATSSGSQAITATPVTAATTTAGAGAGASHAGREQVGSSQGGGRNMSTSQGWSAAACQVLGPGAAETLAAMYNASGALSSALHSSNGIHQPPGAGWLQPCPMVPSGSSGQWPDLLGRRNSGMLPPPVQALATGSSLGYPFRCRSLCHDASSHGCSRVQSGSLRHPGASVISCAGFDGGMLADRCMWDSTSRAEAATRMQRSSLDQARPQHQYQHNQCQHQQLSKLGPSQGSDQAGTIGSGDPHLLSRGLGTSLRLPVSESPSASGTLLAGARPGSSAMRKFARLSSGTTPGAGGVGSGSQPKRPNCIRTRLSSLMEQMDGGGGMGAAPYPAGSLLAPSGPLRVGSVTSPTMPPPLRQFSARRASTTVLENGGHANLSFKHLMELGVSGGGNHFAPGSLSGTSDGRYSATAPHSAAVPRGRESLGGIGAGMSMSMSMGMGILPASSALSGNGCDSSMGMIQIPGIGGPTSNGSEALLSSNQLPNNTQLGSGARQGLASGYKISGPLPPNHMRISAATVVSASASATASGAGCVGRGGGMKAGGALQDQDAAVQAVQALQCVGASGVIQIAEADGADEFGTGGRTRSLGVVSRPGSQLQSLSQSQNKNHALLSQSPSLMPEPNSVHATSQSSLGITPSYLHWQHLQQQQQAPPPPMQLQAHLQTKTPLRPAGSCSMPFVCSTPGGAEATSGGGAGDTGGDAAGDVTGEVPAESPGAASAAAATISAGGGLSLRMAWFRAHLRALSAPSGRGWTLLLMMEDLTLQVTTQEKMTTLLGHEHKILKALFPRHVIEFLTVIPLGLQEDAPRSWLAKNDCDKVRGGDSEPEAGEDLRCPATTAHVRQLRQLIVQQQLDVIKVSHLATQHKMVTILFSDCVGFTAMCKKVSPYTVMHFLNELYKKLDALLDIYKVYKVETIGDCYVVAGGLVRYDADGYCSVLPEGETDELHAVRVMEFAKAMLRISREVMMPTTGEAVQLRLGLHSGPAMSGVVGSKMPRFTVFGETVEAAHKMESSGRPGRIHVSGVTRELLRREQWEPTEGVQIDSGGRVDSYLWVEEEQEDVLSKQRVLAVYI